MYYFNIKTKPMLINPTQGKTLLNLGWTHIN
jgi:hypothetical protein